MPESFCASSWGCKPEPQIFPSPKFQPGHERIQVDQLAVALEGVMPVRWLNLVECAFSKMARSFLRQIRVNSLDELKQRILQGIDEMNAAPVRFQWKSVDTDMLC